MKLTPAQRAVVGLVQEGWSLFLTGSAGTGKSEVLRAVSREFSRGHVAVTAITGSAAVALDGQTLHAWAGIGRADAPSETLCKRVQADASAHKRWCGTSLLIVDEVSMVSGALLDKLDAVGRTARRQPHRAFGGLQVLFCGDFHQLPPPDVGAEGWAFEAAAWRKLVDSVVELTEVLRLGEGEHQFALLLEQVRRGRMDDDAWARLQGLALPAGVSWRGEAAHLVATNAKADRVNNQMVDELSAAAAGLGAVMPTASPPGGRSPRAVQYSALREGRHDGPGCPPPPGRPLTQAPGLLRLAAGAKVVFTSNVRLGLDFCQVANGTQGRVTGFRSLPPRRYDVRDPNYEAADEMPVAQRRFLVQHDGLLPVVEVAGVSPGYVVYPISQGNGGVTQLPLRLGWALTVHRAQGMTLGAVVVHLDGVSSSGQAYVALSRCRSESMLRLSGGLPGRDPSSGRVAAFQPAPAVAEFYAALLHSDAPG